MCFNTHNSASSRKLRRNLRAAALQRPVSQSVFARAACAAGLPSRSYRTAGRSVRSSDCEYRLIAKHSTK